jgi:hypothetical protein
VKRRIRRWWGLIRALWARGRCASHGCSPMIQRRPDGVCQAAADAALVPRVHVACPPGTVALSERGAGEAQVRHDGFRRCAYGICRSSREGRRMSRSLLLSEFARHPRLNSQVRNTTHRTGSLGRRCPAQRRRARRGSCHRYRRYRHLLRRRRWRRLRWNDARAAGRGGCVEESGGHVPPDLKRGQSTRPNRRRPT